MIRPQAVGGAMPKYYLLEVVRAGDDRPLATFRSDHPFGALTKGEAISLIGLNGELNKRQIHQVEHTIWMEKKVPVHKTVVMT